MQPISYGYAQMGYPMYPNCFDQLTTHGVIADDLVGYITDVPSPYLQNYVAQRGWPPSMPGQIMPDPLPNMQPPQRLPRGDVYQTIPPQGPQAYPPYPQQKPSNTWRKVALTALIVGLTAFGLWKGKQGLNWLKGKLSSNPPTPPPQPQPAPAGNTSWWQKIKNYFC